MTHANKERSVQRPLAPIEVIKLGGSVLRTTEDFTRVVCESRRCLDAGRRPLLVLSARAGTTDELLEAARAHAESPDEDLLAHLLATGETAAAALAGIVLAGAGISSQVLAATKLGLCVSGSRLEARPTTLDTSAIESAFARAHAVVAPGFVGHDEHGEPALLGRGGSDLTALFIAHRLGAECRLVKDTGALFTHDPRQLPSARRYRRASWRTALTKGGGLVQPETLRFAAENGLRFAIAGHDGAVGTIIDQGPDVLVDPAFDTAARIAQKPVGDQSPSGQPTGGVS